MEKLTLFTVATIIFYFIDSMLASFGINLHLREIIYEIFDFIKFIFKWA